MFSSATIHILRNIDENCIHRTQTIPYLQAPSLNNYKICLVDVSFFIQIK